MRVLHRPLGLAKMLNSGSEDLERLVINSDAQLQLEMPSTLKNERDRLQGKLEGIQEVSQRYNA